MGILSNGSEQTKGDELTREAARLCARLNLNFIGYVEGFDLFDDSVDVVVTDGFTGNVVLKTAESLGNTIGHILKRELRANPLRKLGGMLARGAFRGLRQRLDPEVYGGAVLLGLEGVVIKAHGSSRERAIANAIRVAAEEIRHNLNHLSGAGSASRRAGGPCGPGHVGQRMTASPSKSRFKNPRARYNFVGRTCSVTGVGAYVPRRILTNADLEKLVDTTDEWITTRTGIKERRIAADHEHTSDLATEAARRAMQDAGITAEQIDLIIVATITPDMFFPSTACLVQAKLGAHRAAAFIGGGLFGYLRRRLPSSSSCPHDYVLVIGAEKLSDH